MHHGMILNTQGDDEGSLKAFEDALSYVPDDPVLLLNYGVALRVANRSQDAINALNKVIEMGFTRPELHYNLALAHDALDASKAAHENFEMAISQSPESPDLRLAVADFLMRSGDKVAAEAQARHAHRLSSGPGT